MAHNQKEEWDTRAYLNIAQLAWQAWHFGYVFAGFLTPITGELASQTSLVSLTGSMQLSYWSPERLYDTCGRY